MHHFNQSHAEFKGFSEHYHQHIFPILAAADGARRAALSKIKTAACGVAGLMVVAAGLIHLYIETEKLTFGFITLVIGGIIIGLIAQHFLKSIRSQTKTRLVGGICEYIGWDFSEEVTINPFIELWMKNGLIKKKHDRIRLEDQMWGQAHGAFFWAMEAHIERKVQRGKNSHWETTFRGSLMRIEFKRKFLGRTVVRRNNALYNRKGFEGMKKVGLVDPVFEKIFQAYGTDQVEARYLLTPDFMQQLVDLERSVDGERIRFGFIDNALMIAVETNNRFEAGSMREPLTSPNRAQKILDEIGAVYNVIDGVLLTQSPS